jgi:hypothetical protein
MAIEARLEPEGSSARVEQMKEQTTIKLETKSKREYTGPISFTNEIEGGRLFNQG